MKCLGVLLCYNDGDLLADSIAYLREQRHDIVLWDHGSTDNTAEVVARMRGELLEASFIPGDFDFYELYPAMSRHMIENYVRQYDWISWPDQDEFLEGPSRSRTYYDSLVEVSDSDCDWIEFNNVTYWFTVADDPSVASAPGRIRHYSLFPDCAPRIRSWRASATRPSPRTPSSTGSSSQPSAPSSSDAVTISNFKFSPGTETVKSGTKVTVTNNDSTAHTATSNDGSSFDTGDIDPGSSKTITVSKPGTYAYHCTIHSFMHGTLVVQ